ncbi:MULTISPECIES: DUF1097 domain-containing protein [Streptomyces]|uniref:DUF1097 domain-containing protein n=1 Tax=Streptomyces evansiae TaxID=3075535 RepID=A0ABU2R0F3_9ACTN|nr:MULTISPECIES: DUF1097 domain-containing protein [unclassified Streptomyces]EFL03447.1 conserved hypothetical protein [Streptomyces sp. SPB78]MDT0410187.1 DUF1097 domain-containing protein [Streptomyces sp. DSM 41979]MYQ58785.1 DUF1097 domain-containing protein [Streptomyces sp. SID4926]SCE39486.1 Protein of unknown function [Streptomyces sp. DfronAA-171]
MRERLPHEIVASVLAGLTAFIGGNALHLPPWAVFLSWAAVFLLGGPRGDRAVRLWCAMPAGSAFALVIVLVEQHAGGAFGEGQTARNAFQTLVILVVNTALMYTGRLGVLVPGMFLGFASYFATFFGGFGYDPGNPWAAWLCVVAMNALGPVFAHLSTRLTFPVREAAPARADAPVTGADAA